MANLIKLKKQLEDIAYKENYKLCNIDIKPISSGGANYTTDLYIATISESSKPDINIFAKVSNVDETSRAQIDHVLSNAYIVESFYYKELAVTFKKLYEKNQVPPDDRLAIAKYYGDDMTRYAETMFLEDLVAKGFKNFDRMKTFNWEYAATAVAQLARLHALGMAIRVENPEEFENLEKRFNQHGMIEFMAQFLEPGIKHGMQFLSEEHKERVVKYFAPDDRVVSLLARFMDEKTTLTHGDFRPNNLMHRRQNGKLEIVSLDYQTLRVGNPVGDLVGFIFTGSDEEFRRLHYQHLLDHYYSHLTLALQKLGVDVDSVYPRKTFDNDELEIRPYGLVSGMLMYMVTVDPENAPQLEGDMSNMMVAPNELALVRMSGIVKDFIRWGML